MRRLRTAASLLKAAVTYCRRVPRSSGPEDAVDTPTTVLIEKQTQICIRRSEPGGIDKDHHELLQD